MFKVVGDYQLTEKIGKGNFADVYLGTNQKTGTRHAVKVISKETFSDPKLIAGLDAEIKIMKEFTHPNIVQLYKYFSSEKNYYLVLEFCAGGDLNKYIKKNGRLSENHSVNFLFQLTEGLFFLHKKNFIHRDLKPANILLSEQSENAVLKLSDFGFARHLSQATLAQTRCGTPLYMAPEILEARDYDSKADVWSLGCIFFEMLVGTCPFKGVNETDLLFNIRSQSLKIPGSIEVSKGSIGILSRLLERTSTRRASIDQLLQITRKLVSDQSIAAEGSSSVPMKRSSMEGGTSEETTTRNSLERRHSAGSGGGGGGKMSGFLGSPEMISEKMRSSRTGERERDRDRESQHLRTPQQQQQQPSSSSSHYNTPPPVSPAPSSSPSSANHNMMKYFASGENTRQRSASQQYTPPSSSAGRSSKYHGMTPPVGITLPMESPRQQQSDQYYNSNNSNAKSRSRSMGDPNYGMSSPFFPGFLEENYQNNNHHHHHTNIYAAPRSFSNETERSPLFADHNFGKKPSPRHSSTRPTSLPVHHYYEQQRQNIPAQVAGENEDGFVVIEQNPNAATAVYNNNPKMSGIGYNLAQQSQQQQHQNNIKSSPIPIPTTSSTTPSSSYQDHQTSMKPSSYGKASSNPAAAIWDFTKQTFEKTLSSSFGTAVNMATVTPSSSMNSRDSNVGFQFQPQDSHQPNDSELTESLLFQNLLQRCETYCDTINVITNLADQTVMQEQLKQSQSQMNKSGSGQQNTTTNVANTQNNTSQSSGETTTTKEEGAVTPLPAPVSVLTALSAPIPIFSPPEVTHRKSSSSFASPSAFNPSTDTNPNESPSNTSINSHNSRNNNIQTNTGSLGSNPLIPPPPSKLSREATVDVSAENAQNGSGSESMDNYLAACSLYFHAMTILKSLINSLSYTQEKSEPFFQWSSMVMNMKNDLSVMFDQLLTRAENCQRIIDQLILLSTQTTEGSASSAPSAAQQKVMLPKAALLMLQEAVRYENHANQEDHLGNLERSLNLYVISKKLVYGVTLTYSEDDARKVRNQLKIFSDNLDVKIQNVQTRMRHQAKSNGGDGAFVVDESSSTDFFSRYH